MTVAEPFGRGGPGLRMGAARRRHDARLVIDKLVAVDTDRTDRVHRQGAADPVRRPRRRDGRRRVAPFEERSPLVQPGGAPQLRDLVPAADREMRPRVHAAVAFDLVLAALRARPAGRADLREHGSPARVASSRRRSMPWSCSARRGDAVLPLLGALGIDLCRRAAARGRRGWAAARRRHGRRGRARRHAHGRRRAPGAGAAERSRGLRPGRSLRLVAGHESSTPPASDLVSAAPGRSRGPTGRRRRRVDRRPLRGAEPPAPFAPVLRGRLTTSGAPLYFQARASGQSLASHRALWSPPGKIAGRFVAPYLASARPGRIGRRGSASACPRTPPTAGAPRMTPSRSRCPRRRRVALSEPRPRAAGARRRRGAGCARARSGLRAAARAARRTGARRVTMLRGAVQCRFAVVRERRD